MDHNQERRRGGHYRGHRRGPDRRGPDRRSQPPQNQPPRDQVDVEQIMRDIRARIAQRQGVDFSTQQIQDLAARKLESILDPRVVKPSLLEALRRGAGGSSAQTTPARASSEPIYTFEDTTLYDSHRGLMRFMRRLLNPILKLFFNPNPLIRALHLQAKLNVDTATREAERERRQNEWNALHYEIVQRLVTEIARLSLDVQSLTARVESLNGRVDFNDRRVRGIEGASVSMRQASRTPERTPEPLPAIVTEDQTAPPAGPAAEPQSEGSPDSARRRRRRRRGRRGTFGSPDGPQSHAAQTSAPVEHDAGSDVVEAGRTDAERYEAATSAPVIDSPPAEPVALEARVAEAPDPEGAPSGSEGDPTD
jgi:hypothetical protein